MPTLIICPACKCGYRVCGVCLGGVQPVICQNCDGSGLYYDTEAEKVRECQSCEGDGEVDPDNCINCDGGQVSCDTCCGSGQIDKNACTTCGDNGVLACQECQGTGLVMTDLDVLGECDECEGTGVMRCPMNH